jgi:succinoglycan biosynthesis transport protein ExoP
LHSIPQIEALMEMPSLAVIPRSKRTSTEQSAAMSSPQRNINVLTQPKSQFTEAFRSLQTSLLLATAGQPPKLILFTSATPSEGKTTTATNLAPAFCRKVRPGACWLMPTFADLAYTIVSGSRAESG